MATMTYLQAIGRNPATCHPERRPAHLQKGLGGVEGSAFHEVSS